MVQIWLYFFFFYILCREAKPDKLSLETRVEMRVKARAEWNPFHTPCCYIQTNKSYWYNLWTSASAFEFLSYVGNLPQCTTNDVNLSLALWGGKLIKWSMNEIYLVCCILFILPFIENEAMRWMKSVFIWVQYWIELNEREVIRLGFPLCHPPCISVAAQSRHHWQHF